MFVKIILLCLVIIFNASIALAKTSTGFSGKSFGGFGSIPKSGSSFKSAPKSSGSFPNRSYGGDVHVKGYYRSDGSYVQPHMRSGADGTTRNNFSYNGNINPYTGKYGTKNDTSYSNSPSSYGSNDSNSGFYIPKQKYSNAQFNKKNTDYIPQREIFYGNNKDIQPSNKIDLINTTSKNSLLFIGLSASLLGVLGFVAKRKL